MKTISTVFLFGLLLFNAGRAWLDYASAVPMPGQVQLFQSRWDGKNRSREYDFGICRYTVVERNPLLAKIWGFFGAGAPELNGVVEGDRVTLWALLASGRATPVLRMPIWTTIVPLLYLLLVFVDPRLPPAKAPHGTLVRIRPDGSTEVRQVRHRCLGCIFLDTLLAVLLFGALILIAYGMVAPFLEGESTLREGLAFVAGVLLLAPVMTVVGLLEPAPSVRWNEATVWIHGVPFKRSAIRQVVLRNDILEIHREGSRWKRSFVQEAAWTGAQLEKLGYEIGFAKHNRTRCVRLV